MKSILRTALLAGIALTPALVVPIGSVAHAQSPTREYSIAAQDLGSALRQFARQSGRDVVFDPALVAGKTSSAVQGSLSAERALQSLLVGSDLKFTSTSSGYAIRGEGIAGSAAADDESANQEIVVTGTNIRGAKSIGPVVKFSRDDIASSGVSSIEQFSRLIPQNFASQYAGFSYYNTSNPNAPSPSDTSGTTFDLRGLGSQATLTIVNGRRITQTSFLGGFDISVLPVPLIDRIDILTDGASAIYGADAVGGVVNFITRRAFEGVEAGARWGVVTDGHKRDLQADIVGGKRWGNGGGYVGASYSINHPLLIRDRKYIQIPGLDSYPDTHLLPKSKMLSFFASANHEITDRLTTAVDGFFSQRHVKAKRYSALNELYIDQSNTQTAYMVMSNTSYRITDSWLADLFIDYSRTTEKKNYEYWNGDKLDGLRDFNTNTFTVDGRVSGSPIMLPGGPLRLVIGYQYREEQNGSKGLYPPENKSVTAVRRIKSYYGEMRAPVIADNNAIGPLEELEFSFAGRHDDYTLFGGEFSPMLGARARVAGDLHFSGTYSESFRVPNLFDDVFGNGLQAGQLGIIELNDERSENPSGTSIAAVLVNVSNNNLRPEHARSWTLSTSYTPQWLPGSSLKATYFNISYQDAIVNVSPFAVLGQPGFEEALVNRNPTISDLQSLLDRALTPGQAPEPGRDLYFFNFAGITGPEEIDVFILAGNQNLSVFDTDGIDVTASLDRPTEIGEVGASLNVSYIFALRQAAAPGLPAPDISNRVYRPANFKLRGSARWAKNGYKVVASVNHVGSYKDNLFGGTNENPAHIGAFTTFDLGFGYETRSRGKGGSAFDGLSIDLVAQNVFDASPPYVAEPTGFNFDSTNSDPLGRFVSLQLRKRF